MADAPLNCVVVGASGAIGSAFVTQLADLREVAIVHALSRTECDFDQDKVRPGHIDILDEDSVARALSGAAESGPIDRVIIATGILHEADLKPEKSLRDLDPDRLTRLFATNCVGPALVIKHALPHMPRDRRTVIAALSARVGSISGNQLGGWYGYRASKAALNMMLRTASIEARRRWPQLVLVGLHPGTVDSSLSRPFHSNLPPGQLQMPGQSVSRLCEVIEQLRPEQSGGVFAYDGAEIPA